MGFRFRLERVLDYRRSERGQRRGELLELERAGQVLLTRLREATRERQAHALRCGEVDDRPLLPLDLLSRGRTADAHRRLVESLTEQWEGHQDRVRQARAELAEANRRVRMLEKLREKKLDAYREQIEAQERKILDDIQGRKGLMRLRRPADPARSRG